MNAHAARSRPSPTILAPSLAAALLLLGACGGGDPEAERLRAENEALRQQLAATTSGADATDAGRSTASSDDWAWVDEDADATPTQSLPAAESPREPEPEPQPTRRVEQSPATREPARTPEPEPTPQNRLQRAPEPEPEPEPRLETRTASAGTAMDLRLDGEIAASTAQVGDAISATLTAPVTASDGSVVLPAGTRVEGRVTEVQAPRKAKKKAIIAFAFQQAVLPDGTRVDVAAGRRLEGEGWTKKDGAVIGGSAAGGALLGQILGGDSEATAAGAVIGGAIGSGIRLSKRGDDVVLPAGTEFQLPLDLPVSVERPAS